MKTIIKTEETLPWLETARKRKLSWDEFSKGCKDDYLEVRDRAATSRDGRWQTSSLLGVAWQAVKKYCGLDQRFCEVSDRDRDFLFVRRHVCMETKKSNVPCQRTRHTRY